MEETLAQGIGGTLALCLLQGRLSSDQYSREGTHLLQDISEYHKHMLLRSSKTLYHAQAALDTQALLSFARYVTACSTSAQNQIHAQPRKDTTLQVEIDAGACRRFASKLGKRHGEPSFDVQMLPSDQARLETLQWTVSHALCLFCFC